MSIRVCANGHLTGQRHCYCGADAVRPLRDRVKPIPRHELASVQPVKQKVVEIPKPPFRLYRHLRRIQRHLVRATGYMHQCLREP
jgi:hypothetical protein